MNDEQIQRLLEENVRFQQQTAQFQKETARVQAELRASHRLNGMLNRQMEQLLRRFSALEAEIARLRGEDPPDPPTQSAAKPGKTGKKKRSSERKPRRRPRPGRKKKPDGDKEKSGSEQKKPRRKPLPKQLKRFADRHKLSACPCCSSQALSPLPPLISEKLVYFPARLGVRRTQRDKARCRDCGRISTAPQPREAVPYGQFDGSVLAHLLYSKFALHLPIDRIREDWQRMGHTLASSSAQTALQRAGKLLQPIYDALHKQVLSGAVLHSDGTGLDQLLPDQPGKNRGQVRVYCNAGVEPITLYTFNETKEAKAVRKTLRLGEPEGFRGYLVSDFGSEYAGVYDSGEIVQSGCWQHVREYFAKAVSSSPKAARQALAYIGVLFDIEAESAAAFETHTERLARRRQHSTAALDVFERWMKRRYLQYLPDEPLRVAIQYVFNHRTALRRFLEDGRIPIDNNLAERELGVVGRGRKNFLFTGSAAGGRRLALLYSIVRTCQRNGVDPYHYLDTVLPRLSVMRANRKRGWRIDELLPMAFKNTEQHAQAG